MFSNRNKALMSGFSNKKSQTSYVYIQKTETITFFHMKKSCFSCSSIKTTAKTILFFSRKTFKIIFSYGKSQRSCCFHLINCKNHIFHINNQIRFCFIHKRKRTDPALLPKQPQKSHFFN